MPISTISYGTVTNITITLASLANNAARQSLAVDNSVDLFLDAEVYLAIPLVAGTPGNDLAINIWLYGSHDGTNYGDPATGLDTALTIRNPTNLRGPFPINTPDAGALTYKAFVPSVAQFFGGILPVKWGIVVENRTNLTFGATEGNFTKQYRGIKLNIT
jgi:hypothetical protein